MSENDDLMISTIKCTHCGKTWLVTEEIDGRLEADGPSKRTSTTIVCANCGASAVWEIGIAKIERRQG